MNKDDWIRKLKEEGFTELRVCPIPPNERLPEHTHDEHTVHIILDGELTISDSLGTKTYRPGDRVDFPNNTTHIARGATDSGIMLVGIKK